MNPTIYKQLDTRWSDKPYPTRNSTFGGNGCGCCACVHVAIEQESKADWNPETLRPWMVNQGYAVSGKGTMWQGIYDTLKYIGHDSVVWIHEADPMSKAWAELDKGNRIGVLLVNDSRTPDGTYWTSSGHYVAFNKYWKDEQGRHYFNIKDSGGRDHDGEFCYERSIKGALPQLWIVERIGSQPTPPTPPTPSGKIPVNGIGDSVTVKALQRCLGLSQDGVISNQYATQQKYRPALTAVTNGKGGSKTVWKMQQWCNLSPDGYWGGNTSKGLQKKLRDFGYLAPNEPLDNICGKKTMSALQECINNDLKPKSQPTPPTPTPTTDTKVIDVSSFQPSIDFAKVKADGVQGVIVKCGFRHGEGGALDEDSDFMRYIKGAYDVGLPVGIYFFTEAVNAKEGKEEAQYTIKLWQKAGIPISYPIGIDSENVFWTNPNGSKGKGRANSDILSKAKRTEAIKAFCEEIKAQGYTPMIYASLSWFEDCLDMSQLPYDVWCAQYYKECQYKGKVVMWQYTSDGKVNGIPKVVDLNHCYIEPKKVNPPKPQPTPTPSGYTGALPTDAEIREASYKGIHNNIVSWDKDIADSGKYHYVTFSDEEYTHECPICTKRTYDLGWNCIGYAFASWRHGGGIPCTCNCGVIWNGLGDKYINMSDAEVLASMKQRIGVNDIKLIRNGNNPIPASSLEKGDLLMYYNGNEYAHMAVYIGNGKISDDTSGDGVRYGVSYSIMKCLFAIRYTGTRSYMKKGDEGKAVLEWQDFLDWWSDGAFYRECGKGDGIFGANTHKWTVAFQEKEMGKGEGDGTVGQKTISVAKSIRK